MAAPPDLTIAPGEPVPLGEFFDPDDDAPWRVSVAWGDGTGDVFIVHRVGDLGAVEHAYAEPGFYQVRVTVDERGGQGQTGQDTVEVAVGGVTLAMTPDRPGVQVVEGEVATLSGTVRGAGPGSQLRLSASTGLVDPRAPTPGPAFEPTGQSLGGVAYAAADLDDDGDVDAVTSAGGRTVVWLNDGNGTFRVGQDILCGGTTAVDLADLDGDGSRDILVRTGNLFWVMPNRGDGTFDVRPATLVPTFSPAGVVSSMSLGDVDGDGDLDAVRTEFDDQYYPGWPELAVMLNDGEGRFAPGDLDYPLSNDRASALGDLDDDGDLDVILDDRIGMNDGSGRLTFHAHSGGGLGAAQHIAAGDLDGDGDLDAIYVHSRGIGVLEGDGAGNLDLVADITGGYYQRDKRGLLGDLDGDGDLDVWITDGPDRLLLNQGNLVFARSGDPSLVARSRAAALADFDGDGALDVLRREGGLTLNRPPRLRWDWTFATDDGPSEGGPVALVAFAAEENAETSFDLVVANGPPGLTVRAAQEPRCGRPLPYSIELDDPSTADRRAGFTLQADFRVDGRLLQSWTVLPQRVADDRIAISVPARFLRGQGVTLRMDVRATDKDGASILAIHTIEDFVCKGNRRGRAGR